MRRLQHRSSCPKSSAAQRSAAQLIEDAAAQTAAEVERTFLSGALLKLDMSQERVGIGNTVHVGVGRYPRKYYSIVGEVTVERSLYRPVDGPINRRADRDEGGTGEYGARNGLRSVAQRRPAPGSSRLPHSRTSFVQVAHTLSGSPNARTSSSR